MRINVQSKKEGKDMTVFNVVLCVFCMRGSRNFRKGEGVQAHPTEKSSDNVFFVVFLVLNFNLFNSFTERVRWFIFRNAIIFEGSRGGPTFSRGGSKC